MRSAQRHRLICFKSGPLCNATWRPSFIGVSVIRKFCDFAGTWERVTVCEQASGFSDSEAIQIDKKSRFSPCLAAA
jgi:hypothetical protein